MFVLCSDSLRAHLTRSALLFPRLSRCSVVFYFVSLYFVCAVFRRGLVFASIFPFNQNYIGVLYGRVRRIDNICFMYAKFYF
jgi:hypothetical protein